MANDMTTEPESRLEKTSSELASQWGNMNAEQRAALAADAQKICDRLNDYEATHLADATTDGIANNVWEDVIYHLDDYDDELTEYIDEHESDRFADINGIIYYYSLPDDEWLYICPDDENGIVSRLAVMQEERED